MAKALKFRQAVKRLIKAGCRFDHHGKEHDEWVCPCGEHTTQLPRHTVISAGVVRQIDKDMACRPRKWMDF